MKVVASGLIMKESNKKVAATGRKDFFAGSAVRPLALGAATIPRPVIFVVDSTTKRPPVSCGSSHDRDIDNEGDNEPFDAPETSTLTKPHYDSVCFADACWFASNTSLLNTCSKYDPTDTIKYYQSQSKLCKC